MAFSLLSPQFIFPSPGHSYQHTDSTSQGLFSWSETEEHEQNILDVKFWDFISSLRHLLYKAGVKKSGSSQAAEVPLRPTESLSLSVSLFLKLG